MVLCARREVYYAIWVLCCWNIIKLVLKEQFFAIFENIVIDNAEQKLLVENNKNYGHHVAVPCIL